MPTKRASEIYCADPLDGSRVAKVGEWASEKHLRLRRYVDITRATRRKWSQDYNHQTSYIDLYCGPGRAIVKGTNDLIDGSALVAATEAMNKGVPFDQIYIADLDRENVAACASRLKARGCRDVRPLVGAAAETASRVVQSLDHKSLHIALLDPFNIKALPFDVIRTLAWVKRMDMIIHVSTMDLQRNIQRMMKNGVLSAFAPGWEKFVDPNQRNELVVRAVFQHWRACIEALDYRISDNIERVAGAKNQPLYWLVLATRSELADTFWGQVSHIHPQGELL